MRAAVFAFSAVVALVCSAPASAGGHCTSGCTVTTGAQTSASHYPQPEPDVGRHEPPDPCRQFHTLQAHARCVANQRTILNCHSVAIMPEPKRSQILHAHSELSHCRF